MATGTAARKGAKKEGAREVEAYFRALDHPLKEEMEAVRAIIVNVDAKINERLKGGAPSFTYDGVEMASLQPRSLNAVNVVFTFPAGRTPKDEARLLEGAQADRRVAKFHNMVDVKSKKKALESVVKEWIGGVDK